MNRLFLWMLIPLLAFLSSCNNELDDETINPKENSYDYPFYPSVTRYLDNDMASTRAGVLSEKKWDDFAVINIYFMNGEEIIKQKVKEIAKQYTELTTLTFKYVDNPTDSHVRIRFAYVGGNDCEYVNWSFLGTDHTNQSNKKTDPTMNLVVNDRDYINSNEFRGEVLRNFGRMLGMIYEYTYVDDEIYIELNKTEIERDFELRNWKLSNTEKAKIKKMFMPPSYQIDELEDNGIAPCFDATSIMLPLIPPHWIDYSASEDISQFVDKMNTTLSENDKKYIASVYPKPEIIYEPGKEGDITVSIEGTSYNQFFLGWDYRTNQSANRIINDYPTIGIGEYEWTTVNLRIKYGGPQFNFVNYDNRMVKFLAGDAFGDDANTVEKFEKVFGSWATENSNKNAWLYATSYRENATFERVDANYEGTDIAFNLPDATAIYQLIGQTPQKTGNIHRDFRNFTFGLPAGTDEQIKQKLDVKMPFVKEENENLSKLSLVPLGSMHGHAANAEIYSNPQGYWGYGSQLTAFINPGTGVVLKMQDYIRNFNFQDPNLHYPIYIRQELYHWGAVRYCRALTDKELGYKLYVDESADRVIYLKLDQQPESGYSELPRGLERGLALGCLYKNEEKGIYYFNKSWSKIKAEAATIRNTVRQF